MIRWFAHNPVAANLLMFAILAGGILTILSGKIPLEFFPTYEFERVKISTSIRGATPNSVEEGVTLRIEEAIQDLEGIDKIVSRSSEGSSTVNVDVEKGFDSRDLLNDIKLRVDAISTLPSSAERPKISIPKSVRNVISVVVSGDRSDVELQRLAEIYRDKMLLIDGISEIEFDAAREYEMTIEVDPVKLDSLTLTLNDISRAINASSIDLSAGNIKSAQGEVLVRTSSQAYSISEYNNIPIVTRSNGSVITLADIATLKDGFDDNQSRARFNGKAASVLEIYRGDGESFLAISSKVRKFIKNEAEKLPNGISLGLWRDRSRPLSLRLNALTTSAWQGGLLVILLLALFLRPSVAAWVCLGIPVSFMGSVMLMPYTGATFNMISLFAFILALGIVVDDAIVTGENVYRHMRMGKDSLKASIDGTIEVAAPVTFGILTTIAAFTPLLMIEGRRGAMFAQIPAIVIPILLFSLVESKLVLPAHLRHSKPVDRKNQNWLMRIQQKISYGFERFIIKRYQPLLNWCISNKLISIIATLLITTLTFSSINNGVIKRTFFPPVEHERVTANLTMPAQTPYELTEQHIDSMVAAAQKLKREYVDEITGESVIVNILSTAGARGSTVAPNIGRVTFEITPPEQRSLKVGSRQLAREWRKTIGGIPGAEQLSFRSQIGRAGEPIDILLRGTELNDLIKVKDQVRSQLSTYQGLFDIQDNLSGGKDEFQLKLKPSAYQFGISLADIAGQVRSAFFGLETQRIQRGRDEIRVMLRLPLEKRSSLEDLYNLAIQLPNRNTARLSEVATIETGNSPNSLYRTDRFRTANITADADTESLDMLAIKTDLSRFLDKLIVSNPQISYEFEGESKEQSETNSSLFTGILLVLLAIYALLAIPFKSYGLPIIVMSVIPLGYVGAVLGHYVYNLFAFKNTTLSVMSNMGLLALTGVVINDSLVLVDYINKQRQRGVELMDAVMTAGARRFRPVILTSLTTFFGLTPLLLDKSTQAEFLKPMAISLGFGILFATFITLLIVPINYVIYENTKQLLASLLKRIFLKHVPVK